jgi:hypothetical protein
MQRAGLFGCSLKPKTSPAWPPFSTGALAGGRKGGGIEGADRAWGCFFKPLMNTQAALMRTGPLMDTDER